MLSFILLFIYIVLYTECYRIDSCLHSSRKSSQTLLKLEDSYKDQGLVTSAKEITQKRIQQLVLVPSLCVIGIAATAITSAVAEEVKKKGKKPRVLETDLGIKYIELKKGSGPFPVDGDFVIISYNAFLNNGTLFDSTESKLRKPISFRMGKKQIIPGLESVVSYMQPGGEVTCTIPSQYAYGERGVCLETGECLVPPNETLKYFVKLISVGNAYN